MLGSKLSRSLVHSQMLLKPCMRSLSSSSSSSPPARTGGGFFQRLSSFLTGAGLTALASQYYIYEQVRQGNLLMVQKQQELEQRLGKLEKKK